MDSNLCLQDVSPFRDIGGIDRGRKYEEQGKDDIWNASLGSSRTIAMISGSEHYSRSQTKRSYWDTVLNPSSETTTEGPDRQGPQDKNRIKPSSDKGVNSSARASMQSHTCRYCRRPFGQASNLNKHVRVVHLQLKPFSCKECYKPFSQRSVADNHYRSVHLGEKPFDCPRCQKGFSDKSNLKKHIKLVHLKEKKHTCTHCSKRFGERRSLNDHVSSVHLKQKPHTCPVHGCAAKFGQKSHLSTHMKCRHPS